MASWKKYGALVGGALVAGAVASYAGAMKLYNTVIPRQGMMQMDIGKMTDLSKWEEYKKVIGVRKEWLMAQNPEEIVIEARDGIRLHAYYLPAEKPSNKLMIGLHGYTSQANSDYAAHAYFFHNLGYDCLLPDHRAHGLSEGEYVGFGILDRFDCRRWIDYVNKRFDGEKQILLHGTSMGASTALMAIGDPYLPQNVQCAIADCGFTSPYDVFEHVLHVNYHLPPHPILDINERKCQREAGYGFKDYSTLTALAHTKVPTLFIHGDEDNFVPTWMSRANYAVCASPKEIFIVSGAGHGASYYEATEKYEEVELAFLEKWMPKENKEEVVS